VLCVFTCVRACVCVFVCVLVCAVSVFHSTLLLWMARGAAIVVVSGLLGLAVSTADGPALPPTPYILPFL
jgi:hypothetical protein